MVKSTWRDRKRAVVRSEPLLHIEFEAVYLVVKEIYALTAGRNWYRCRPDNMPTGSVPEFVDLFTGIRVSQGKLELYRDNWTFAGAHDSTQGKWLADHPGKVRLDHDKEADPKLEFNRRYAIAAEVELNMSAAQGRDPNFEKIKERILRELHMDTSDIVVEE